MVHGSRMHYVEAGSGSVPILFMHGNPTSSYLWRNVIPHVAKAGRCIAVDLIGMGKSDKPEIGYTYDDHYRFVNGFIDALGLKELVLVIHDWGSALGFRYAHEHTSNVRAIAFMEAILMPAYFKDYPMSTAWQFKLIRVPFFNWLLVEHGNLFVKKMLPDMTVRRLTGEERAAYAEPYPTVKSRKPTAQWPMEIPIDGSPPGNHAIVDAYSRWLPTADMPMLCFEATPGMIHIEHIAEYVRTFKKMTIVQLGIGRHYVQEDHPDAIGEGIAKWLVETKLLIKAT